jgi:hypothetical protein
MPAFGRILKEFEDYLKEQKRLENDKDYQDALVELDDFLRGRDNVDGRRFYSIIQQERL